MRKAAFHNLGCKVNSYETEAMQQLLDYAFLHEYSSIPING